MMLVTKPIGQERIGAAVLTLLTVAGTGGWLLRSGWVGPDIDTWYGAGLVRAVVERPLAPESLGHVPKLGHLILLAPAVALGGTPERWFLVLGVASLAVLALVHWRLARALGVSPAAAILALAISPLVWRATLDGGSVAWGWACVVMALARRAESRGDGVAWLAVGGLFRPECVGVGIALGVLEGVRGRKWWTLAALPALAAVGGNLAIDLLWSGSVGATSIAHAVFESVGLEQVRGHWGFTDSGHPWLHLSVALLCAGVVGMVRVGRTPHDARAGVLADLLACAIGFSAVTAANVVTGGTLFVRFLLPWASVLALFAATLSWPDALWRRAIVLVTGTAMVLYGWAGVRREFVGTYPAADALLVARRVARATDPALVVAMDAGARAVTLGSGARPWKTTPWLLQGPDIPCQSHVIVARGALVARLDSLALNRCGPWRDFVVDSAQVRVNLRVLLARRVAAR